MIKVEILPNCKKKILKLNPFIQQKLIKKRVLFQQNPYHKSLKTHKLRGKLKDYYSFSIDYHFRVLFKFTQKRKKAVFIDVGTHQIYR